MVNAGEPNWEEIAALSSLGTFKLNVFVAMLERLHPDERRAVIDYFVHRIHGIHRPTNALVHDAQLAVPPVTDELLMEELEEAVWGRVRPSFEMAQATNARFDRLLRSVPLDVACTESALPDGLSAIVLRSPMPSAREVVVLSGSYPSVGALASALNVLRQDWLDTGRVTFEHRRLPVESTDPPVGFSITYSERVLAPLLEKLRRAEWRRVEGFGELRCISFPL